MIEKENEKTERTERKLFELLLHIQRLDREYQQLLEEINLTPEQLQEYLENSENFSPPIWDQLQEERKKLDTRLDVELKNIREPHKTKKTFQERGEVQKHWLFIR